MAEKKGQLITGEEVEFHEGKKISLPFGMTYERAFSILTRLFEFYYLNAHGNWCDIGFGTPTTSAVGPNLLRWAGFGEPPTPV